METKIKRFTLSFLLWAPQAMGLEMVDYTAEKKMDVPLREQSVIISKEGYYPKALTAFVGEKVRFYVTSTVDAPSCLIIADAGLTMAVGKGRISEGEVFFGKPGEYAFHCPAGNIFGKLTVLPRPKKQGEAAPERKIASENSVRLWRPREE